MNVSQVLFLTAGVALHEAATHAGDLQSIDRAILKEPAYRTAPKHCLVVFGTIAQTRVWLVLDGDKLFIDRNGNLDLTEAGENVKGQPSHQGEIQFNAGIVTAGNGVPPKARLEVFMAGELTFVYCHTEGNTWQRAVVDKEGYLAFGNKPQTAPVLHFRGPLTIGLRFNHRFKRQGPAEDLDIMVGTPGVGPGIFVRYGHETVAKNLHPVVGIEFPGANGQSLWFKTALEKRC